MRIITANIKDNPDMPDPQMRADIAKVETLGQVVFFQEIGDAADRAAVHNRFSAERDWTVRANDIEIPICVSTRHFEVLSSGSELTHHGRAKVSPNRYYSWVVTRQPTRPKLGPVVFMNTHFISGAFNASKSHHEWRAERWHEHYRAMKAKIAHFHHLGYTVVFGGDFNRVHVPKFSSTQRWLVNTGIDKIGVIEAPGGTAVNLREQTIEPVGLNSDHDAKVAVVRFKRG